MYNAYGAVLYYEMLRPTSTHTLNSKYNIMCQKQQYDTSTSELSFQTLTCAPTWRPYLTPTWSRPDLSPPNFHWVCNCRRQRPPKARSHYIVILFFSSSATHHFSDQITQVVNAAMGGRDCTTMVLRPSPTKGKNDRRRSDPTDTPVDLTRCLFGCSTKLTDR